MKYALATIVLGIVGGALGAVGTNMLWKPASTDASGGPDLTAEKALGERMDRLEEALEESGFLTARLEGRAGEGGGLAGLTPALRGEILDEYEEALARRLEPRVQSQIEKAVQAMREEGDEEGGRRGRRGRPRKELAEVAREIGLSAGEEDQLRRIYQDTQDKLFTMLAGPDGDVAQVKSDFDAFKNDDTKRPQLMQKYMPRFFSNIGNLMQVQADQQTQVLETVGEDKAAQLQGFDIVEANPMGMDLNMSARARR